MIGTGFIIIAEGKFTTLMAAGGALILILVVVMIAVRVIMKKYDPRSQDTIFTGGRLSIEQAEDMYSKGLISEEEFSKLRGRVLDVSTDGKKDSPMSFRDSIIDKESDNNDSADDGDIVDNTTSSHPGE